MVAIKPFEFLRYFSTVLLSITGLMLSGCVILPIDTGNSASTIQGFEADGDLQGNGVGFAGYWSRPSQPGFFLQLQTLRDGAVGGEELASLPPTAATDPIVEREQVGWCLSAGTTWQLREQWTVYGGLGAGYSETWIERFDSTLSSGNNGEYHTTTGDELDLEVTAGALYSDGYKWINDVGSSNFS